MSISPAEQTEQLDAEQRVLVKADRDIEEGWQRIRKQEDRVLELRAGGHDISQAQQLAEVLKQTLAEWERHRVLIVQRIAYLQRQLAARQPEAGQQPEP
ncbi:hypothetical protein [Bradyrhizobium sp. 199]|uniref:hypothetical protein n=1 Tax=Bradyrhizobium sp. 199 TaxID=2782664 RepID=UPI001FF86778|nr:hypothetical protein [Bradyrhizobium sp. 199]MCK1359701.1 hypothetical protein [Bradyrhizobium sp. 199]